MFNDKNWQAETNVNMWPKKPQKDMWSNEQAMLMQHKMLKKQDYKNCQSIKNVKPKFHDLNCQSTEYYESKSVLTRNVKKNILCS